MSSESPRHPRHRHAPTDQPSACVLCGEHRAGSPIAVVPPSVVEMLRGEGHALDADDCCVCSVCLTAARIRHAHAGLVRERGELTDVEHEIARRAATHTAIADAIERGGRPSPGQRAADAVARIGGSWRFVLGFGAFLITWIAINGVLLARGAFDPYPFILLNLLLSCLAAIQAPIIMMSQARMADIDRTRAAQDFRINLKAELEVAALHEKVDHLLHQQWDRLVELQDLQIAILEELRKPR